MKSIYTVLIIHQLVVAVLFYSKSHQIVDLRRRAIADNTVQIIPQTIPRVEQKILCATFLEAVFRFYENPANEAAFEQWCIEKGGVAYAKTDSG